MSLLQLGEFKLHSGGTSRVIIDCNALTDSDMEAISWMLAQRLPPFGEVIGVPRGGMRLADAMRVYAQPGQRLLVCDDVCTTGNSLEAARDGRLAYGAVIFARGPTPNWVCPLLVVSQEVWYEKD